MRKIIVAGVLLILAAYILAAGNRYEIAGAGPALGYRVDKWTGEVVAIQAFGGFKYKVEKVEMP